MDSDQWQMDDTQSLNALMDNIADSIYFKDRKCRLRRVSRKMALDLGFDDPAEIVGKTDRELFGDEFGSKTMMDDLHVMETGEPIIGLVESRSMPDGETNWTSTTKLPIMDSQGEVIGLLGITREINELKRAEINLQYLATHDILTSLPNRYLLSDRMQQTIRRAKRMNSIFAVLYVDLDGFKLINDRYGHDAGDQVLKQVAKRLDEAVRGSDTVARLGGDEFVVILDAIEKSSDSMLVAQKINLKVSEEIPITAGRVKVTASIGIGIYPNHGSEAASLLWAADQAMYQAKRKNSVCMIYSPPKLP